MVLKKEGVLLLFGIFVLAIFAASAVLSVPYADLLSNLVRVLALYGFMILSVATSTTPFLKEITQLFGRPFLKTHHNLATFGIVFTTLHPILHALQVMDATVFLPRIDSWMIFWTLAGRPALIVLYIAVFAGLLRRKAPKNWRFVHALMYLVLFLGIVHANLIGTDFQNTAVMVVYDSLFAVSMMAFILKRYRNYSMKRRAAKSQRI